MKVLETDRLLLRPIQQEDFEVLHRMNSDPVVMRYVGDGSTRNHAQMVKEMDMLISYYERNPGLGIWATVLKDSHTFVGASGLVYYNGTKDIEMGYRLPQAHRNKGYATEASFGLLRYGFETLGLQKTVCSAHTANLASRKVMEKIGMRHVDDRQQYGCMQAYYEIYAADYAGSKEPSF